MTTTQLDLDSLVDRDYREVLSAAPRRNLDPADVRGSVETLRQHAAARRAQMEAIPLPESVSVEDHRVPGTQGDVMVRLYRPARLAAKAPALYWIHGGGMVLGSVEMSDPYCARIADRLSVLVASVEYRLAPEHPYPTPLEDCYVGLRWLASSSGELGVDADRIAIGGASAGGGLAAGLALLARDRDEVNICFQLLVYPMLDDRNITNSSQMITDPRVWNRDANLVGWNAYLDGRAGEPGIEPYAAPARATDLAGLPPAYINVGTLDLFLDEDIAYAQALQAALVPVELHVYPGAFHGSNGLVPNAPLSQRWLADELAALDRALNRTG